MSGRPDDGIVEESQNSSQRAAEMSNLLCAVLIRHKAVDSSDQVPAKTGSAAPIEQRPIQYIESGQIVRAGHDRSQEGVGRSLVRGQEERSGCALRIPVKLSICVFVRRAS